MNTKQYTILVVDDESTMLDILRESLTQRGYLVHTAEDGVVALKILRDAQPDLVLTDFMMSPMSGIELLRRIKAESPETGVIIFTGYSTEETVIRALRAGASDYLKKPFDLDALDKVIQENLRIQEELGRTELDVAAVVREEKDLEFDNDPARLPGIVNQLTICAANHIGLARRRELSMALYEVILNAMEHGNLEITEREKSEHLAAGDYMALVQSRRDDPVKGSRRVFVKYRLDDSGLCYAVRDEGPGFEWRSWRERDRTTLSCAHGRGLMLAEYYADDLTFNTQGNEVILNIHTLSGKGDRQCSKSS